MPDKDAHAPPAVGTEAHRLLNTEYWGQGHGPYGSIQHAHFGAKRRIEVGYGNGYICHDVQGGPMPCLLG